MPEVWEQKDHLRAGPFFRGYIQEELKDSKGASRPCRSIDYVITHELCHMQHNHHGPAFFALLNRVMPDWEKCKTRLEFRLA